jgi:RimJ/RimL family protein N-acetyltransferase
VGGPSEIRTKRLVLRRWRASDREPYAALNADPIVMEHMFGLLTREQSDAHIASMEERWDRLGYAQWAVEVPGVADCIGFVGLASPAFDAHFTPAVEVGWRLAREHWGHGYATEAATASLDDGFDRLGLDEVVSFTTPRNQRSQAVMQRLGMTRDPADDFDHPSVGEGHPLRRHVLYRVGADDWRARRGER